MKDTTGGCGNNASIFGISACIYIDPLYGIEWYLSNSLKYGWQWEKSSQILFMLSIKEVNFSNYGIKVVLCSMSDFNGSSLFGLSYLTQSRLVTAWIGNAQGTQ